MSRLFWIPISIAIGSFAASPFIAAISDEAFQMQLILILSGATVISLIVAIIDTLKPQ